MNHVLELIIALPHALKSGRPITLSIQVTAQPGDDDDRLTQCQAFF